MLPNPHCPTFPLSSPHLMYRLLGDILLQRYFRHLEVQVPKGGPVI
nr:hypothetical protein [uncultured Thermosynechococcus sp.]